MSRSAWSRSLRRDGHASARATLAAAGLGAALAGCAAAPKPATATAAPAGSCSRTVSTEIANIASRIYGQAAHGRDVAGAVARVERSAPLAAAVARDDPAATRAALRPLLRADIRRIEIARGHHALASFGSGAALAPARGSLRDAAGAPVGRFALATGTDSGLAGIIEQLTGAQVVMRSGRRQVLSTLPVPHALPAGGTATVAGTGYTLATLPAESFPSGGLRIELLIPAPDAALCGRSSSATAANTVGAVGRRLLRSESAGPQTEHVLHVVASDPRFIRAVADRNPAAVRTRIVRFFEDPHLHVVRIRARDQSERLINDVGGPYVLAPASTVVRSHGRLVGTVTLSIQDDTGYIKLMHRFTGADVVLHTATGEVPGSTLSPGRARLPARGAVTVRGRRYQVFSFDATAFPSGPLRVSLLTS